MKRIYITESQFKRLVTEMMDDGDMSYEEVAKKVWAGEIEPIQSIHDPAENIMQCGNVLGNTPIDVYGRLFKGVETGKIYFLEL